MYPFGLLYKKLGNKVPQWDLRVKSLNRFGKRVLQKLKQ